MTLEAADGQLPYVYLFIDEAGEVTLLQLKDLPKYYSNVEDGTHQIIRVLSFSEEARAISGKNGRADRMLAEGTTEEEAEDADSDVEKEVELEWAIEWEAL